MSKDLKSAAGIQAEIVAIGKMGKTLDLRVQHCAVAALQHMVEHKDHTLLVNLYDVLPKGMRRSAMASWIMQFSQLTANMDGATKAVKPFILDKAKTADVEGAATTMWYDCGKPEQTPDQLLDVNKTVMSLLKKVKEAREAGRPVKGLDAETLAALQSLAA